MHRYVVASTLVLASSLLLASCTNLAADGSDNGTGPTLKKFQDKASFEKYEKKARKAALKIYEAEYEAPIQMKVAPPMEAAADASAPANPEITNNQTVGVDEGGIVKQIGEHLIILQDGRLFTAHLGSTAGARLRLSDRQNVYRSPSNAADWYDEMLVKGDRILVTAYSYREGASEITVFRMDDRGKLTREGRYLMSSHDYFSTENYATRIVGDSLVIYSPHSLFGHDDKPGFDFPRLRRAKGNGEADKGDALFDGGEIYRPLGDVKFPVVHAVSICPLGTEIECRTTAFVGPASREFYVSPNDVFLWVGAPDGAPWGIEYGNQRRKCIEAYGENSSAMLYRIPISDGEPSALRVSGFPADQFAFSSANGRFRALLSRPKTGCISYTDYEKSKPLALLDISLTDFGKRVSKVDDAAYHSLPSVNGGQLENRFIADWLVYGGRKEWISFPEDNDGGTPSSLFAVPLAKPSKTRKIDLRHNVIRIDQSGGDAVITGYPASNGKHAGLSISTVKLRANAPGLADTLQLTGLFESEARSHAFGTNRSRGGKGMIALPTSRKIWRANRGWSDSETSQLSYIGIDSVSELRLMGALKPAGTKDQNGYQCEISCVDWYGNSRPIFAGGRIFALLGTELIEGRRVADKIREISRLNLTGKVRSRS